MAAFPPSIDTVDQLEDVLSAPNAETIAAIGLLDGDLLFLGAGGKMGPTLARLAHRCAEAAGASKRVIAVSRFGDEALRRRMEEWGIETVSCDLLDDGALAALPDARNVVYMAGRKFGSEGNEPLTWALNSFLPGLAMHRFKGSNIVALSTGNVYPLVSSKYLGAKEDDPVGPIGEYAMSCLGRERIIQHRSAIDGTPVTIIRLNYAVELRYGVLLDIARHVRDGEAIDLTTGYVNFIWQGDANAAILQSFALCASPPVVLNVTGRDAINVRHIATCFGDIFDREPVFTGVEAETALLSDASRFHELFPFRKLSMDVILRWTARWMEADGPVHGKPTRYDEREGRF